MERGSPVADGAPLEVLTEENLARVYGISARMEMDGDWPLVLPTGRTRF